MICADLGVGQPLLREELLIGLVAELAVQALGLRDLGDLGIDQPLRQVNAIFVGEGQQARAGRSALSRSGSKSPAMRRIVGFGILLAHLLQPPLHRVAHLALGDLLVADLGQRRAAHPEADLAGSELEMSPMREAGEDREQKKTAMMPVPTFDLDRRRKKESIEVPRDEGKLAPL